MKGGQFEIMNRRIGKETYLFAAIVIVLGISNNVYNSAYP